MAIITCHFKTFSLKDRINIFLYFFVLRYPEMKQRKKGMMGAVEGQQYKSVGRKVCLGQDLGGIEGG